MDYDKNLIRKNQLTGYLFSDNLLIGNFRYPGKHGKQHKI